MGNEEVDVCPICLEEIGEEKGYATPRSCEHRYCLECFLNWMKTQRKNRINPVCAYCRQDV